MFAGGHALNVTVTTASTSQTSATRVDAWDGWRGIAIALVLCGHFYDIKWLWEDRMGVDVFFVLSGMLMSRILFEKRLSLRDFYIRRLSRVFPVLLAYIGFIYCVSWLHAIDFSASEVLSTAAFLRTYYPTDPGIWDTQVAIGHLWSLNVEEHAYIMLSLLTLFFINTRYIAFVLLTLGTLTLLLSAFHYSNGTAEEFPLYLIRTESAVVFIFYSAGYGLLRRQMNWTLPSWVPILCLALTVICYVEALPLWLIFSVSPIALAVAVNHLDHIPRLLHAVLTFPALRYLGLWSYSIYLWQQFFYEYAWAFPLSKILPPILAVVAGILSFYLFENPVRHYINNRWSKNPNYRANEGAA
jgi:peptidoglycan/LPS O-acetylase OafA/YrhL